MVKQPSQRALGIAAKVAAQLAGLTKYEGQPCKEGHVTRYADTGQCAVCSAQRSKARRARLRGPTVHELREENERLRNLLESALGAEARAWARVAELEDQYEPVCDLDLLPA